MTITTTDFSTTIAGDGSNKSFVFNFPVDSETSIVLDYTDTLGGVTSITSNYDVLLNPVPVGELWPIGGTITYPVVGSAIASGTTLKISRELPLTQDSSMSNQGASFPNTVERGLDILTMQVQQINEAASVASDARGYAEASQTSAISAAASAAAAAASAAAAAGLPTARASGTSDAITATYSPSLVLTDGLTVSFVATAANTTTTPTFNPDSTGDVVIVRDGGDALEIGDIPGADAVCLVQYDGTNLWWTLLNPAVAKSALTAATATSATTATTATTAGSATNASFSTTQASTDSSTKIATTQFVKSVLSAGGGVQVFTSSGTFTVPSGISTVYVSGSGGGGGGAGSYLSGSTDLGAGGGGSGNSAVRTSVSVTPGDSISVTIGAGGAGGTRHSTSTSVYRGVNGSASSFGSYVTLGGGGGGGIIERSCGGLAGGSNGGIGGSSESGVGGFGAASCFGPGGAPGRPASTGLYLTGSAGIYGGGGGAGTNVLGVNDGTGGAGGNGIIIVEW